MLSDYVGGIVFTRSRSIISDVISFGQKLEGLSCEFIPSHVAILAEKGGIWESSIGGVQESCIAKYISKKHTTYVAIPRQLSDAELKNIFAWAEKFKGRGYGYLDLAVYLVDLLGTKLGLERGWLTKKLNTKRFLVCSEFVGYVYGRALHFRFRDDRGHWIPPSTLTPLDIWRQAKRDGWKIKQISPEVGKCCL